MKSIKTGRLEGGPMQRDGKMVDEWIFHTARPASTKDDEQDAIKISVKVSLVKAGSGLAFRARVDGLGVFEDSDIQKLHETVETSVNEHSVKELGAIWEDWLRVTVCSDRWRDEDELNSDLQIKVEPVKRGVSPKTGKVYLLSGSGIHAIPMEKFLVKPPLAKPGEILLHDETEVSFIPATPENIAALMDARDRLSTLRKKLAQAFSQDQIADTLDKINSSMLAIDGPARKGAALPFDEADPEASADPVKRGPRP